MRNGQHFYFGSLRKLTAAFGNMFNEIQIQRLAEDDTPGKIFTVPLAYAPRRSFLVKLREDMARSGPNIATTLPRMSFEMIGMAYDPDRQLNPKQRQISPSVNDPDQFLSQFTPAPITVNFDLNLYSMNIDDNLQILEQIVPYFTPSVNLKLNEIEELGMKKDVEITLDGISTDVQYEGVIGDDREVIWTLSFTAASYVWPPITNSAIIKRVIATLYNDHLNPPPADAVITVEVDPFDADETDPWTVKTTVVENNG